MDKAILLNVITEFVTGLLKKAEVTHAGNCLLVSMILQEYLLFLDLPTELINAQVNDGSENINHYYLQMNDGTIIDATASQFTNMPVVYIGLKPTNYLSPIQIN